MTARKLILTTASIAWVLSSAICIAWFNPITMLILLFVTALLCVSILDAKQKKHSLLYNFPLVGRLRWVFEHQRTKIQQYFIEHDTNGTPYNLEDRSDVYQKSKDEINTVPFGTQLDVYKEGYEYVRHSMYPKDPRKMKLPRVVIGSKHCSRPYSASLFNISAMSFGALSDTAIESLNIGAKLGKFYHNTGEGGISNAHVNGGDLCFQIGTGYFGAGKTVNGVVRMFDPEQFAESANKPYVKMIEIKLSQGAKPGHGGILPALKNTEEIAAIRGIKPNTEVVSPPYHTAFDTPRGMLEFIDKLRFLCGGKPVGIKMCVGQFDEVTELIATMQMTGKYPDFITVDGGEGGTGAAPLVFTNSVGTPLFDALEFVCSELTRFGLRDEIKVIASGKAATAFDVIKMLAKGADMVNAARSFMLSMGCIQARECNSNTCPVGIATQNKKLSSAIDPALKSVRVYNYHNSVVHEVMHVVSAMGLTKVNELKPEHIITRH